jgi:hypothetical protein
MQFEWDETKNEINKKKHHISFEEAIKAFEDINRKIKFNSKHSANEIRYYCFGKVNHDVLTVRYVHNNKKIRIIGAGYWREGKIFYENK